MSCACCPYDNKYILAFLRVTPPILHCAARGARERGIICHNTILLTWPPMYSRLAKAIKWLAISSALVSHPVSLSPSNRIRMSGLYLCITGISRRTKSLIVLPPFPNIRTRAVSSNLKEGRILASVPACMSTCKRLQNEWPQMIAERTIPTVQPYWTTKFERNKKQLTFGDAGHKIGSRSTITRKTSWLPWLTSGSSQSDASTWPAELVPLANS